MKTVFRLLLATLVLGGAAPLPAAPIAAKGTFRGTVYQIDTVFNFVDVNMPGGRKRFYTGPHTVAHVHGRRAALIDIAMGDKVRGTYITDSNGTQVLLTIDDVTGT